ncbi:MAG: methylmalonyl-CoA epimerase [marine benthic group bacterium]|nr:methylmalonyl-CoA epimerase [Candidatus Benthicola marisminoris]
MFKIDHIGIAVNSLQAAVSAFEAILGENPAGRESVPSEGVEVVFFGHGSGRIELLEALGPESPIARFIERRGQGLHHICLQVPDLQAAIDRLALLDVTPLPPGIRPGAEGRQVAFFHPRDCAGVLVELTAAAD